MTNKKNTEKNSTSETKNTTKEEKLPLYEAVERNPTKDFIIVGALSRAGLIDQYEQELKDKEKMVITPSITESELNKLIQDYAGE